MKKKILSLGVIAILMVMLFTLTGCGNEKTSNNTNSESTNQNNISNTNNTEYEDNLEEITGEKFVERIETFTDEGLTTVKFTDGTYYIVDKDLKLVYDCGNTYIDPDNIRNGYITISPYWSYTNDVRNFKVSEAAEGSYVIDLKGNVVLDKKEGISYSQVSKSGYVAVRTQTESLAGEKVTYKIIDLDGNTVYEGSETPIIYIGQDMFYTNDDLLINAKTNEKTSYEDQSPLFMEFFKDNSYGVANFGTGYGYCLVNLDTTKGQEITDPTALDGEGNYCLNKFISYDEKYILFQQKWGDDYAIGTADGKLIKDLSEGGYKDVSYNNNEFAVISETGYYYIIDLSGNYVLEPVKITEENSEMFLVKNTLYALSNQGLKIYNPTTKEYEEVVALDNNIYKYTFTNINNDKIIQLKEYSTKSNYAGDSATGKTYINLESNEIISTLK